MVAVKAISADLKKCAIRLYLHRILRLPVILAVAGFSRATFFRSLRLYRATGFVAKEKSNRRGRTRILLRNDLDYILSLIRQRPDWFLDELLGLLRRNRFISVHFTTIFRELERQNISRKRLRKIAAERNEPVRLDFIHRMAKYRAFQLGFLDEFAKDERTVRQSRWSRKGQRAEMVQKFVRGDRVTGTGLLTQDGIVASDVVVGSMNRARFLHFLEHHVMPLTSPYPGPLSVLVMDNAKIHHGEEIAALAERFGVRIEYLPPYSPDFNPIEEAFSKIKAFIRRNADAFAGKKGAALLYDVKIAMEVITPSDAMGYIRHAGYA